MQTVSEPIAEHRLTLAEVLGLLVADGMVAKADADRLVTERRMHRGDHHPLVVVADQKWRSVSPPQKLLSVDFLTQWLAEKTGLDYYHIDPLKINFSAVTEVMSNQYAGRFKILPVEVTTREVVIATSEPYVTAWKKELGPILRLDIRCVLASPLDISRYHVEFYNLARSIKGAERNSSGENRSGIGNFEQLVELGKTKGQMMPTTSTSCMWWTGCGSTRLTSVPAISTWSRAGTWALCVSALTVYCTRSTAFPPP